MGRTLKWVARIVVLTMVMLAGFVAVYTRTDSFRELLRDQIVKAANTSLRGSLRLAAVEGSIWSHLTLRDVTAQLDGKTVAQIEEVQLGYSLGSLLRKKLDITQVVLVHPVVRARQGADETWDVAAAFTSRGPEEAQHAELPPDQEGGALPLLISVLKFSIVGGIVEVTPRAGPSGTYRVEDINLDASASVGPETTRAQVHELSANLRGEDIPSVRLVAGVSYGQDKERTHIQVDRVALETAQSALHMKGEVRDLEDLDLTAVLEVERLSSQEVRQLLPAWPLLPDVEGSVRVAGKRADLKADASVRAGEATVDVDGWFDLSGEQPRYRADAKLAGIDPERLLGRQDLGGIVSGRIHAEGSGSDPGAAQLHAELAAQSLRVPGAQLGDLAVVASLDDGVATVRGDLRGAGTARLDGKLQIDAQQYEASLDVRGVNVGQAVPAAEAAAGDLNFAANLEGRGFDPETMNLHAEVNLDASQVGPLSIDSGHLAALVSGGQAELDALVLRASGTELSASGRIGLAGEQRSDLRIVLGVADLKPWLELAGQRGSGAVRAEISVGGPVSSLAAKGTIDASQLRLDANSLAGLHVDIDLAKLTSGAPEGRIAASVKELNAGVDIPSATIGLDLDAREGTPAMDVSVDARTKEGYDQRLHARVVTAGERVTVDLRDLSLQIPTGTWQLDTPARIARDGDVTTVTGFRLTSDGQAVTAEGTFGRPGNALAVRVQQVKLGSFRDFAGEAITELGGILEADITLRGTPEAPEPSGQVRLRDGRVGVKDLGVTIHSIGLTATLTPTNIDLNLDAQAKDGTFQTRGRIQLVDYQPDRVDVQVELDRWPVMDTAQYSAEAGASVAVRGSLSGPDVEGEIHIVEASLRPDVSLPGSEGPPPRDQTIVVVRPHQTEDEGKASDSGETPAVESGVLKQTHVDLHVVIERNVWVKKDTSALEVTGDLRVEKERGGEEIALIGDVRVEHGWIYLYGRRFDPERGVVTFTGGHEIDPTLDVVLASRIAEYEVRTIVKGTGSKPELSFESEPELEDADILALLMFGQPLNQLGEGEKASFDQQAANFAAGYAASRLSQQLGDAFGIQISELDVTQGRVGIGRYLTPKTYVSIIQGLTSSREVRIDYYFTPSWTVRGSTSSEGDSGIDLFWKKKY